MYLKVVMNSRKFLCDFLANTYSKVQVWFCFLGQGLLKCLMLKISKIGTLFGFQAMVFRAVRGLSSNLQISHNSTCPKISLALRGWPPSVRPSSRSLTYIDSLNTMTWWSMHHRFINEETEAERLCTLPKDAQLTAGFKSQYGSLGWRF